MRRLLAIFAIMFGVENAGAVNNWQMDAEAQSDTIPQFSREFARGETWTISPKVVDDGIARVWPTNAIFLFFWQRQNMSTNWWVSTNVIYPVYHDVSTTTLSPVITSYITNTTVTLYPTTNSFGTNTYYSTTNSYTSYVTTYTVTNVVDTGRVSAVWSAGMDVGANSYNWFIGEFENGSPCYRVNGTITMRGAPGYGATFTGNPISFPWATTNFVTNMIGQVTSYALRAVTNGAPVGYWILQTPLP